MADDVVGRMTRMRPLMTMPHTMPSDEVRLRCASIEDWPMIRRWLGQPEVIRWWGPRATTEAEVMLAMGTAQAICRIIEINEVIEPLASGAEPDPAVALDVRYTPIGYAHAIDAGLAGPPRLDVLASGTWQIDLFVASAEHRGRGIGGVVLKAMRDEVFETTLAVAAAAFVAVGNEKAVRAYEQAGFKWRAIARDANRGADWLMLAERPTDCPSRPAGDGQSLLL